jgi:hypothetical protein
MNDRAGSPRTSRRLLWLLVLLFFAPLLVSFWLYYGSSWRPAGRTNHGELIEPPRQLPAIAPAPAGASVPATSVFTRQWSLVYVGDGGCNAACREVLHLMRQTHASLGRLGARVQLVFLVSSRCCDQAFLAREHPTLLVIDASGPAAAGLVNAFGHDRLMDRIFIVDPLGNLMMRYDTGLGPKGLQQDLKKLLELSHIG